MSENEEVTKVEQDFYLYMNDRLTSFTSALFTLIFKADIVNRAKLMRIYPEHVQVVTNYQMETDYWEDLQNKIQNKGNKC